MSSFKTVVNEETFDVLDVFQLGLYYESKLNVVCSHAKFHWTILEPMLLWTFETWTPYKGQVS